MSVRIGQIKDTPQVRHLHELGNLRKPILRKKLQSGRGQKKNPLAHFNDQIHELSAPRLALNFGGLNPDCHLAIRALLELASWPGFLLARKFSQVSSKQRVTSIWCLLRIGL